MEGEQENLFDEMFEAMEGLEIYNAHDLQTSEGRSALATEVARALQGAISRVLDARVEGLIIGPRIVLDTRVVNSYSLMGKQHTRLTDVLTAKLSLYQLEVEIRLHDDPTLGKGVMDITSDEETQDMSE
eukprot:887085_1